MTIKEIMKTILPVPVKNAIRPIYYRVVDKYKSELGFWRSRHKANNGTFENKHYNKLMTKMAEESDSRFLKGKVVADFGCGPRGSLVWADTALLRIGIDVLADRYANEFKNDIISHGMIYLKSTENVIPLPSNFVDVMFTLNALDHVDNFSVMCEEIIRVIKPGGLFVGSFNLEEPPTACEPQQLNEEIIRTNLLNKLKVQSYRVTNKKPQGSIYDPFFTEEKLSYTPGEEGCLWVRAEK